MQHRLFLNGASALAMLASTCNAQIALNPATNYPTPQQPDGVAAADFDADGFVDLAVTTDNPGKLGILRNLGDGTFSGPLNSPLPSTAGAGALVAADFDADGDPDLAVAFKNLAAVQILLNNAGSFAPGQIVATGANPRALIAADFNADGHIDLAVANRDSNTATVMLNNGSGSFTPTHYTAGDRPRAVAAADFDADGDIDLAVTNQRDRSITILLNTGNGAFVPGTTLSTTSQLRPDGIDAGDIDADGDPDLVLATTGNNLNLVSIFINTGGSFTGPFNLQSGGTNPGAVTLADLDRDGDPDIVVANQDSANIAVLENTGAGAFAPPVTIATASQPSALATATLNPGTLLDIAVTNTSADSTSVILSPEGGCYADCDQASGPGVLDLFDFLCFQNAFVAADPYACQCDPNPACDVFDFLCFQNAFVAGCP